MSRVARPGAAAVVALAFAIVASVPTAPSALYGTYEKVDGFPTAMVAVVFAIGIVGVLVGMFVLGHLSDVVGRKWMLLIALGVQFIALIVFLVSPSLPVLLVARVLSGLGAGIAIPTATAYILDLLDDHRDQKGPRRAAVLATAANLAGFAAGPILCGFLAEFAPAPLATTYIVLMVALVVIAIPVWRLPETVTTRPVTAAEFRPRFRLPAEDRGAIVAASFSAFAGFAVIGLFGALAPVILREVFGQSDRLAGAALVGTVFAAAALTQVLLFSAGPVLQPVLGSVGSVVGLGLVTFGVLAHVEPVFVAGGALAGGGAGLLIRAGVGVVARKDAEAVAAFFLLAYSGFAIPVILAGLATLRWPLVLVVPVFAAVVAVLAVVTAFTLFRRASAPSTA
jgi:MFS family permease